jgi:LemA protein
MELMILVIVLVVLVGYVMATYNSFQTIKTRIEASIQEIGNQLKRQASLIPNLESAAKGFLKQEKGIFKSLTDARKAVEEANKSKTGTKIDAAIDKMSALLPKLNVLVEDNPEIKSDKVIGNLMNELRDTADKLMYSRRTLIDLTADYNVKVVTFPSNLVAMLFKFGKEKGLITPVSGAHTSVSQTETQDVKINL